MEEHLTWDNIFGLCLPFPPQNCIDLNIQHIVRRMTYSSNIPMTGPKGPFGFRTDGFRTDTS